jgi:hypothetical protein
MASLSMAQGAAPRSLAASIEERLLVPTYSSQWAPAMITAHRSMALPFQLSGQAHRWSAEANGTSIRLAGVGREKLLEPLLSGLFGELSSRGQGPRRIVWSAESLATIDADLIAVEVHRWMAARFRRAGWIVVPEAVRWQGELSQVPPAQPQRSLVEDLHKFRKHGFTVARSTAAEDWQEFYTHMVEPLALSRHGKGAWLPSPRLIDEFAANGTLHFVSKDGVRVAATCSLGRGDTLWLPLSGIRDGDPVLLRQGAATAALALTLEWARSEGYRRVDLGRTGPFIHDGLQQFKRKWGLSSVPDPLAHLTAVWVGSETVRQAFSRQPLLVEDGTGLRVYSGEAT